jgi:hypothetical protein
LLLDLVSRAAPSLNLGLEAIFNALRAREKLDPTGLGEGFAVSLQQPVRPVDRRGRRRLPHAGPQRQGRKEPGSHRSIGHFDRAIF